jgi:adenosylmethionine-8-amino-7-oxononanoate aminotransferase
LEEFKPLDHAGDVRQCGIMVGIELVADKETKEPYPASLRMGHRVIMEARSRGLIIRPLGDVVVLMPALVVSIEELDRICDVTYHSIREVTGKG